MPVSTATSPKPWWVDASQKTTLFLSVKAAPMIWTTFAGAAGGAMSSKAHRLPLQTFAQGERSHCFINVGTDGRNTFAGVETGCRFSDARQWDEPQWRLCV